MALGILLLFANCRQESAYQKMERLELAKGIRNDTLFFGYYLGMTQKAFFDNSWAINKQSLVTNGEGSEILCRPQGFRYPVRQVFFPEMEKERISKMWMKFDYDSYSSWDNRFSADSLLLEVIPKMGLWFKVNPTDFISMNAPNKPKVWVHIAGNRRIMIFKEDDRFVKAIVSDLTNSPKSSPKSKQK